MRAVCMGGKIVGGVFLLGGLYYVLWVLVPILGMTVLTVASLIGI